MLITLVRDSVLQCFCHSCRAPVMPAGSKCRERCERKSRKMLKINSLQTFDVLTLQHVPDVARQYFIIFESVKKCCMCTFVITMARCCLDGVLVMFRLMIHPHPTALLCALSGTIDFFLSFFDMFFFCKHQRNFILYYPLSPLSPRRKSKSSMKFVPNRFCYNF